LAQSGIRYFFTDTHGVLFGHPRPQFGIYAPVQCPRSGVYCLGRDTESSKQVWSALEGYPGDYIYREFYRDIGFDLDYEYLNPHRPIQKSQPHFSSWGYNGYCEVWLNGSNDWIYRHLHEDAERMVELARANPEPTALRRRALDQAARELLLAQASDWAFIM